MGKCLSTTIFVLGFLVVLSALASAKINTKICRKKNGVFPKPGSLCKAYYKCNNFVPSEFLCPPDHHFSTTKLRCDWMELFPCLEKPKREECPSAEGKFLKPGTGCTHYYDCCNGEPTEKRCPQGRLFDPSKRGCELKELYTCIESISTEGPKTTVLVKTSHIIELTSEEITRFTASTSESTSEEVVYSTTAISDSTAKEIARSTASTREATSEEVMYSPTAISDSTAKEIARSTASTREATSEEVRYSTTANSDSTAKEIAHSTASTRESTSEEVMYSTTAISDSTAKEIARSTASTRESTSEEVMYSTIRESTPDDRVSSSIEIKESTPEKKVRATTEISVSTSEEIARSTESSSEEVVDSTIFETTPDERVSSSIEINESTPEEIAYSSTLIGETTSEEIGESTASISRSFEDSTTITIETDGRTTILEKESSSTEKEQFTNEPNIMCPEPFGYFPHPTDKHKFVGCVDNIPTVLTCPSNLIYDHEHRQCVYPEVLAQ